MALNTELFLWIQQLTGNPVIDRLMVAAAALLVFLVPLTLVYLWLTGIDGKMDALYAFTAAALTIGISYLLGLFHTQQPPFAVYDTIAGAHPENSFPSQHTAAVFGAALPLLWRERRGTGTVLLLAGLLTGFSRVYIGEHYPLDIAGGIVAAGLGLAVVYTARPWLDRQLQPLADTAQHLEDRARAAVARRRE